MKRSLLLFLVTTGTAWAGGAPTVLGQSVHVRATNMGGADWVPQIDFLISGDVPDDALSVEYTKAGGAAWGKADLPANAADDRGVRAVRATMLDPKLALTEAGDFHFAIKLAGKTLYKGDFTVQTLPPGKRDGKPAFVVDHDWIQATAQVYFDSSQHGDNPALQIATWFTAHDVDCYDLDATLAFEGKVIATTDDTEQAERSSADTLRTTGDRDERRYVQCRFGFPRVKGWVNGDYGKQAEAWHDTTKHPGKYELKIARKKQPDRTIAFTVDKSGMLVATGPVEQGFHEARLTVPVALAAGAPKGTALYGNAPSKGSAAIIYESWKRKK